MPIPSPKGKEEKQHFISRCISVVKKRDPERPIKQVIAICYSAWRKSGKK